ncbi:MAG TPA: hypothetical protein VGQ94_07355, partial [Terriglobales bacterium]|nr:hypothetical protein [Terriglobales bacterium]
QVVFSGHEHVYERVKPQNGIQYFTEGASAKLMARALRETSFKAAGFDTDNSFMLVEIAGDELYFQTISRTGATVDSGVIRRLAQAQSAAPASVNSDSRMTLLPAIRGLRGGSHLAEAPGSRFSPSNRQEHSGQVSR